MSIIYHKVAILRRAISFFLILLIIPFLYAQEEAPVTETESVSVSEEIDTEKLREQILDEAPAEFLGFRLGDSEVSLFLSGFWNGTMQSNFGLSKSPLGIGFASPESPFLFKQEVDLTVSLWINNRWFVEANFLDESSQNTYRAGYQGQSGEFLKYAGIGNTGLNFPSFSYLDLGGDTPSSIGFYSRFGTQDLNIHALVRYDMAAKEERTFIGGRERTYTDIDLQNYIRGISFALPDINIDSEITVYIEDEKGNVRDNSGRRWRFALPSEYSASRALGIIELSIRPAGMVAIGYEKNGSKPWVISTPVFLKEIQDWFDPSKTTVDLDVYFINPTEIDFGSTPALVVYQSGIFSPYERHNRYDAPSSSSQSASLVNISTGRSIAGYEVVNPDLLDFSLTSDDFNSSSSKPRIFELILEGGGKNLRSAASLFPLAREYPEIYLPPKKIFTGDAAIRFTNINSTSGYYIGSEAIPESIKVYRSGIQETRFSYNQSSGEVSISGSVGQNELIRITYLKRNEGEQTGSIAAGVGAVYKKPSSPFSAEGAVGILWNLSDDTYSKEDQSSMGIVGVSAKTSLEYDFLKAHVAAGYNYIQTDTTGLYRAAGMEGNETIVSMPVESSFISNPPASMIEPGLNAQSRADLIYRNYYNNSVLGLKLEDIPWNAPVVTGINRPYPVNDSRLQTQITAFEFALADEKFWTGFQSPLINYSELFSYAQEIEIPFRLYEIDDNEKNDLVIIAQIGSLSGNNYAFTEDSAKIWEKSLSPADIDPNALYLNDVNYTIARFKLDDSDRIKLTGASFLRIIAVNKGSDDITGRVLIAPPVVRGASFRAVILESEKVSADKKVNAIEILETGNNRIENAYPDIIKKFHTSFNTQRVLKIDWDDLSPGVSAGIDGRIRNLPLKDYRELSFFIKFDDQNNISYNESLSLIVSSGPETLKHFQLEAIFPLNELKNKAGSWSKITVKYQRNEKEILFDGNKIHGAVVNYKPISLLTDKSGGKSTYTIILINPADPSQIITKGTMYIDEIILEDPITLNRINAGTAVIYTRPGVVVPGKKKIPVLADILVSNAFESEFNIENNSDSPKSKGNYVNRTELALSFYDIKIAGNFAFTAAEDTFIRDAGHSISRKIGPFSISEKFYTSEQTQTSHHNINLSLRMDFYAFFDADALYDLSMLTQKWNMGIGYVPKNIKVPVFDVSMNALWQNKFLFDDTKNYGKLWIESFEPLVPDIGTDADNRRSNMKFLITQRTKPVGAVVGLEGITNFTAANNITKSEYNFWFNIPVTLEKLSFNFSSSRGFKRHLYYSGNNAIDDANKFFEGMNDSRHFWKVFPFYSLFAPKLNDAMGDSLLDSPSKNNIFYSSFNEHFGTRFNLPQFYNIADLFTPARIVFRIERIIEQKLDVRTDTLNLNANLGFSALNMFGAMGYKPVFNFYRSDEFNHSFDISFKIPKNEDVSWRLQSVINAGFRGFRNGFLEFVNTFTYRSEGYWTESLIFAFEYPSKKNVLSMIYDRIILGTQKRNSQLYNSWLINEKYEQLRRETLEIVFDHSTDYLRWSIIAGHEAIIRIAGRLNFSAFAKARFSDDKYTENFIFDIQLGIALRFIF